MSPVALAECLRRFIAQAVHFSWWFWCCQFSHKCKWRYVLTVEEEKALSVLSSTVDYLVPPLPMMLFYRMMLASSPHLALDPGMKFSSHPLW